MAPTGFLPLMNISHTNQITWEQLSQSGCTLIMKSLLLKQSVLFYSSRQSLVLSWCFKNSPTGKTAVTACVAMSTAETLTQGLVLGVQLWLSARTFHLLHLVQDGKPVSMSERYHCSLGTMVSLLLQTHRKWTEVLQLTTSSENLEKQTRCVEHLLFDCMIHS